MQSSESCKAYRRELKGRILRASTCFFYREGIRRVRMDDIARALGISKRTLYEIYGNKEELLGDVIRLRHREHMDRMKAVADAGADSMEIIVAFYRLQMEELSIINPVFYEDLDKYPRIIAYLRDFHDARARETREFSRRAVSEGYIRADFDFDIVHRLMDATSQYVMNNFMYREYGLQRVFHNFLLVFFRGICTEKGIRRLDSLMGEG